MLKALLEHGANPNIIDPEEGFSPLTYAIQAPDMDALKILLEFGADEQLADHAGRVPFLIALTLWFQETDPDLKLIRKQISDLVQARVK